MTQSNQSNPGGQPLQVCNRATPLIIQAGNHRETVDVVAIRDEEQRSSFIHRFQGQQEVVCDISPILDWSRADRRSFLIFCHSFASQLNGVRFRGSATVEASSNLLDVMVALIAPSSNPDHVENAVYGAAEVAALFYPESLIAACDRIVRAARANHVHGYRAASLAGYATDFFDTLHEDQREGANALLNEVWPDLTGADEMVLPPGWSAGPDWILRRGAAPDHRIKTRIAIVRRLRDAGGETSLLELAWSRSERWRRRIFRRGELASTRNIVGLADYDIPVNSNNAADLIDYLDAFESQNLNVIPEAIVCDRMGWIDEEGVNGFLIGRRLVNHLQPVDIDIENAQQTVEFRGADQGDEQLADSLRSNGSFEQWLANVGLLRTFPRVRLAIYASFVPPLLAIFRSHSFILSFAGPTSGGKTTTLGCAAATWGCPDQQVPGSLMMTWDTTRVGIERSMRLLDGIPIVIDDTKQARKAEDVAQTVYDVTGGRGRTRGSERGLAATGTWRTVMITSGEQPMTSFSQDGGTRARILEIWNSPFGQTSDELATFVTELREEFSQNYGHAGPRFVSFLIANRARWEEWREQYRASRDSYQRLAGNNNVASRMSAHVAAIEVAARLVHQAIQLPWDYDETVRQLWAELTRDTSEADQAAVGMRLLLNFCATQAHRFEGGPTSLGSIPTVPAGGFAGRWQHRTNGADGRDCRVVYLHTVNELLSKEGFEPKTMKRMWLDRGWTVCNPGKTTLKVRVSESVTEAIAIPYNIITELMDDDVLSPQPSRQPRGIVVGGGVSRTREQSENTPNP